MGIAKHGRAFVFLLAAAAAPALVAAQDNPLSFHNRYMYAGVKTLLVRSAEKMPEEHYGFEPTEAVRTFGQIIGHTADAQYTYCAMVLGDQPRAPTIEKTKTTKADLIVALKEALTYCDRAYDTLTDATAVELVKLGPNAMPKLGLLHINVIHSTEHYGNLITYMRIKNIVPPSSEPGFVVLPPKR